jgi:Tol biopolymer transport system component
MGDTPGRSTAPENGATLSLDGGDAVSPYRRVPARSPGVLAGSLTAGFVLGKRYTIERLVGKGGMGAVYLAIDDVLGKDVALKVVNERYAGDFGRLRDEVLLAQEVSHRNVCRTYDLEEVDGHWLVKMEFVDGETLARHVARAGRLAVPEAVAIARQIAEGLGAAHERGVIHRDLKPQNVLIEADTNRVVLMDFGLARMAELSAHAGSGVVGTPEFMAPEQAQGRSVDGRTDLYALGCVLYFMLVGEIVFPADSALAAAMRHVEDSAPDVRARQPDVPTWLAAVIARLLAKDPEHRFADAHALLAALAPPRRRWPAVALAAVGVGAAVALLAAPRYGEWRPAIRELPAYEENSDVAVWSPDGRSIAYFSDRDQPGHFRVYVESIAEGTSRPITPQGLFAIFPSWTRDGGALLVHTEVDGRSATQRVGLDGGQPELLVSDTFRPGAVDCGAGRVIFQRVGRAGLRLVVRDGGGRERDLVQLAPGDEMENFDCDRDGTRVVYGLLGSARDRPRMEIWMVGLDGAATRALVADKHMNRGPRFHPDGKSVVFSSNRSGKLNLWELPLAGGDPAQLTFDEGPNLGPAISPDGRQVLFQIDVTNWAVFAYGPEGRRRLTSSAGTILKLAVSPDGRDIVAGTRRLLRDRVVIIPVGGGEERTLGDGRLPCFSPDGEQVVYAESGTPSHIIAVPRAGGEPRLVGELPGRAADLSVGPDGAVHVALFTDAGLEAWRLALAGGGAEREGSTWSYVIPAPAGGWRAALDHEFAASQVIHPFSVHLFPPGASLEERAPLTIRAYAMAWDRDGTSLVYLDRFAVHRLELASRRDAVIARAANQATPRMAVSPDGGTVFLVEYLAHVRRQLLANYGDRERP